MLGSRTEHPDQVDPAEALMREVGAQLRQVRLERGEDLDQIAQYLRIRSTYLSGIEQGDMSVMPGQTYALGFLRSYADHLGFDGDDLVAQIKSTVADLTGRTRLRIRTPLPESRLPKAPILVLSLAAIAGIYAGWSYLDRSGRLAIETVAEVPDRVRTFARDRLPEAETAPTPPRTPEVAGGDVAVVGPIPPAASEPTERSPVTATTVVEGPPATAMPPAPTASADAMAPAPTETAASAEVSAPPVDEAPSTASGVSSTSPLPARLADTPQAAPPTPQVATPAPVPPAAEAAETTLPTLEPQAGPDGAPDDTEVADVAASGPAPEAGVESTGPPARAAAPPSVAELVALLVPPPREGQPAPEVHEAVNADARVILHALDVTWVQISSTSDDYLRARTLQPGDVMLVPNRDDLLLWTGNAGGLQVIVDGEPIAPLGEDGAVVRGVSLDPRQLRPGAADPP